MNIDRAVLIAETYGHDVGGIVLRQANAANERFTDDGFDFRLFGYLFFLFPHEPLAPNSEGMNSTPLILYNLWKIVSF